MGRVGIYHIDPFNKIGAIGYWLGKQFSGKGIITKACAALVDYAFNEKSFNRLEIKCGTENIKSKAVAEKLLFTFKGTIRQDEIVNGKYIDLLLYSMLYKEWYERK